MAKGYTLYVMAGSQLALREHKDWMDYETKRHQDEKRDEVTFRAKANRP